MLQFRALGLVCFKTNDLLSKDEPYLNLRPDSGNEVVKWWKSPDNTVAEGDTVPINNAGFPFANTVTVKLYDDNSPAADALIGQPVVVAGGLAGLGPQVALFANSGCSYSLLYEII